MNLLNIITPCSRPQNLIEISKSINIPKENYRWIVVFDGTSSPDSNLIPANCEFYCHYNHNSTSGNSQRNYAIDLCKEGHVYFNDDDTIIHPDLWNNIKDLNNDFITFDQNNKNGKLRLKGDKVAPNEVDSHNFVVDLNLIGGSRWILGHYGADGIFAKECFDRAQNWHYISIVLSTYNYLR